MEDVKGEKEGDKNTEKMRYNQGKLQQGHIKRTKNKIKEKIKEIDMSIWLIVKEKQGQKRDEKER